MLPSSRLDGSTGGILQPGCHFQPRRRCRRLDTIVVKFMKQAFWSGVFPAITTQLKSDQSLDVDATARHAQALIDSGVSGLILLGSLGENQALLAEEKRLLV